MRARKNTHIRKNWNKDRAILGMFTEKYVQQNYFQLNKHKRRLIPQVRLDLLPGKCAY